MAKNSRGSAKQDAAKPVASVKPAVKASKPTVTEPVSSVEQATVKHVQSDPAEPVAEPLSAPVAEPADEPAAEPVTKPVTTPACATPPRKAIKLTDLSDSKAVKTAKKTYLKVFATKVAGLEAYIVEDFHGQDGFNWNLAREIAVTKSNTSIIDQGFFMWGDRRKSAAENIPVENKLPSNNGVAYNRRYFFRCIPDVASVSTKATRDEGLHVLQKVRTNRYVYV